RLPETGLRPALGIVLLAGALGLVTKAGLAIPPVAIVAVPVALGVIALVVHALRARRASIAQASAA
ncbi:MAG TPA: sulfite exporter TauE/SafE family protein, partial [Solirubrobacteraceae bacterium]|nr:sulfite exporter TauE/SafE family protein [Solirubrobacteraceae bacterium]